MVWQREMRANVLSDLRKVPGGGWRGIGRAEARRARSPPAPVLWLAIGYSTGAEAREAAVSYRKHETANWSLLVPDENVAVSTARAAPERAPAIDQAPRSPCAGGYAACPMFAGKRLSNSKTEAQRLSRRARRVRASMG